MSVIRRILSWLHAQHWQPCRELKELFDDAMDHLPEKVINLTEYGLRRWRWYGDVLTFEGHLSGPVYSLGCHFHRLILEPCMVLRENFERTALLCVNWAVLADENSWKCLTWSCITFFSNEVSVVYKWKFCARMDLRTPLAGLWPSLANYPSAVLTVMK